MPQGGAHFRRFYAGGASACAAMAAAFRAVIHLRRSVGRAKRQGSFELRQQLWEKIGGALFVDFGRVSLRSFDLPVNDLRFSAGFGVRYATPVGPLLDVGFPFRPPRVIGPGSSFQSRTVLLG
jgi:outer membrane protein assembly factor BamA